MKTPTSPITILHLKNLNKQYEKMSSQDRIDGVRTMIQDADFAERWVLQNYPNLKKNNDLKATDLVDSNGTPAVEVKFRAGPRLDDAESTGNFFFEKVTHASDKRSISKTWYECPKYLATVTSDGTIWMIAYKRMRELLKDENSNIQYNMRTSAHDTYGLVIHYSELKRLGLLKIVEVAV